MPDEIQQPVEPDSQAVSTSDATALPARPDCAFQRDDWLSFGITTLLTLLAYLCSLAPDVTLTNTGILSTAAMYAGVGPPPGYPLWTIYSWLFVKLIPVSNIAWRVSVGSAVAAALASGLVALMVSRSGKTLLDEAPGLTRLGLTRSPKQKKGRFAERVMGIGIDA